MLKKSQMKFFMYFLIVFLMVFILLYAGGFVPETIKLNDGDSFRTLWDKAQRKAIEEQMARGIAEAEEPVRIVIDKIGVDTPVSNPNTTNIPTLDEYLRQGAVRYPGSGLLGFGNMFIFGHSSNLTVVRNQAYKAFNKLKDLEEGDIIKVTGTKKVYIYKVNTVKMLDKNQALVKFDNDKNRLTLSTCNTFGQKSERYVVEADYVRAIGL